MKALSLRSVTAVTFFALSLLGLHCSDADGPAPASVGASGSGGASGAADEGLEAAQGCVGKLVDGRAPEAERTIRAVGVAWKPACLTIAKGQSVTWDVDFGTHPLHRGTYGNEQAGAAQSPIPNKDSGNGVAVQFNEPGLYPFYCVYHATPDGKGMTGLVKVE